MNLAMIIVFAIGLGGIGYAADTILKANAREEVIDKARIMRASALAMRGYTANEIRPLLQQLNTNEFLPHTVPSFAAQTNFAELQKSFRNYSYREATLNPTNPRDLATQWEADIIQALEGPIALTACVSGAADACDVESLCPMRGHWNKVNDAIRRALEGVSLQVIQ